MNTKKILLFSFFFILFLNIFYLTSCKKDKKDDNPTITLPVVSTANITNIASTTAVCGGTVISDGGGSITERGVCWNTSANVTINNNHATDGSTGTGTFITNISGLTGGITYFVRAYAKNSAGIAYGSEKSFTTASVSDQAITTEATDITINSATLNGTVNPNNTSTSVYFQYGTDTTYGSFATPNPSEINGSTPVSINAPISMLNPGVQYHFRIVAENIFGGLQYGNDFTFTTLGQAPTVNVLPAGNIQTTDATLFGTTNPNYLPTTITFEYGTSVSYGQSVPYNQNPVTGNNMLNVNANITGLSPHATYHYRLKAENDLGTIYSGDETFTTLGDEPVATVSDATGISANTATLNGTVNANHLTTTITFEYGTSTSYGHTITPAQSPIGGSYNAPVYAEITGLTSYTTYHYRVKAVNQLGTTYSSDKQFKTLHAIGDNFEGGIIFYLEQGSQHGLICSDSDISLVWGCQTEIPGADGTAIGTGYQNTLDIVANNICGTMYPLGAITVYNLSHNGYSDWFMPSRDEMALMYTNLKVNGIGNFLDAEYWTSSEYSERYAWYIIMTNGTPAAVDFESKNTARYVRPVRAF